jgi:hypothetical protein
MRDPSKILRDRANVWLMLWSASRQNHCRIVPGRSADSAEIAACVDQQATAHAAVHHRCPATRSGGQSLYRSTAQRMPPAPKECPAYRGSS